MDNYCAYWYQREICIKLRAKSRVHVTRWRIYLTTEMAVEARFAVDVKRYY